ncbi:MAG: potassium channel family protein [Acidobacteriota bacterium]
MPVLAVGGGTLLILTVLWDAFETIVLPRRVSRKFRLTRLFYVATWMPWRSLGLRRRAGNPRENFLSIFGPLSLILLLVTWALGLVFGFALIQWGLGTHLKMPEGMHGFAADLYFSGTTLVTLGLGDVSPSTTTGRMLAFIESGTGFGFLALVVGYLPTLSQAFSRRETNIALLDARAGSPPTAAELIRRHAGDPGRGEDLGDLLHDWDVWSADLLETHISFPVLAYYRSQHDNQSWVAAMTTVLDVCSLIIAGVEKGPLRSARLTFAMARHAVADMSQVFHLEPTPHALERLPPGDLARLKEVMQVAGIALKSDPDVEERLHRLIAMYEPYVDALSRHLLMPLPQWVPPVGARDNWQTTA